MILKIDQNVFQKLLIACTVIFGMTKTCRGQISTDYKSYEDNIVIKVQNITSGDQVPGLSVNQAQVTRTYLDGLGRPIQTVAKQSSPAGKDIVQPVAYDGTGVQIKEYLPYAESDGSGSFKTAAAANLTAFYANGKSTKVAVDGSPFSQTVFENSPLRRLLQQGGVGDGFQPGQHFQSIKYRPNTAADAVLQWNTDGSYNTSNYAANSLTVTDATDADGGETLAFKDNNDHVVLKRQLANQTVSGVSETYFDTYYIYNNLGQIKYIVPPKAVAIMNYTSHSYVLSQAGVNNLIFTFGYDSMGRLVEKTVPGSVVVNYVYDPLNRVVLVQDGNLRKGNQWNYVKYDAEGRAVSQGVYVDGTNTSRTLMQAYVSGLTAYATTWYESRLSAGSNGNFYTNSVFPTANITPLAYSYFDDYDLNLDGSPDYTYTSPAGMTAEATQTTLTRGLPTITFKRTIGSGLSNIWLTSVTFYDKRGDAIQVKSNNQLNYTNSATVTDSKTYDPDFTGKTLQSKVVKITGSGAANTVSVLTTFTYDANNIRLTAIDQTYNTQSLIHIATYTYNELGQVVLKKLSVNPTALQNVDYRYNTRGQILSINNSTLTNDSGTDNTNGDTNDLFGMGLLYDKADANVGNTGSYSGRITGIKWMTKNAANTGNLNERSYKYSYDLLDRLAAATYAERLPGGTGTFALNSGGFNESGISYDENGNLLTLSRNQSTVGGSTVTPIDNLHYTYNASNPNQLQSVTDGTGGSYAAYGFKNITGSSTNYAYDPIGDGNLTSDYYKGLTIGYNVLNRTDKTTVTSATGRYINYTYDAGGNLIRKQQYDNSAVQTTTDYIDGFVYLSTVVQPASTLSYFPMPEGRVMYITSTSLKPEFVITDQQGNARFSFRDNGGTIQLEQENSYYAYGLAMAPIITGPTPNTRLYNGGSEWQNDYANLPDYYQTGFRNYDAALGRFVAVDPIAESAESMTGYQYANNNPVVNNDPGGDAVVNDPEGNRYLPPILQGGGNIGGALGGNLGGALPEDPLFQWALSGDPRGVEAYANEYGSPISVAALNDYIDVHPNDFYADNGLEWNNQQQDNTYDKNGFNDGNVHTEWTFNYSAILNIPEFSNALNSGNNANQGGNSNTTTGNGYDLDPSTVGHNYFSSVYIGPDNPISYNRRKYYYDIAPRDRADAAARQHDLGYDAVKATGISGVLFDTDALPADLKLIGSAFSLFANPFNGATLSERTQGFLIYQGIGTAIAPKAIIYLLSQSDIKN